MKITGARNSYQNIINSVKSSKCNTIPDVKKDFTIGAVEITGRYNAAFTGLFSSPENAQRLKQDLQMIPNKEYIVDEDTTFLLGGDNYELKLGSPQIRNLINGLNPKNEIIFGRNSICTEGMDNSVSREHLKISRNTKGQLIAKDVGSSFGTKIKANITVPDLTKGGFSLNPGERYLLPQNSIIYAYNTPVFLYDYKNLFDELKEGDSIIIGRQPDSDIQIQNSCVSSYHLKCEKDKDGIIVTDLYSKNGSSFKGLDSPNACFQDDFSAITDKAALRSGIATLLPNDSQLYLGKNFTIDLRNPNIIDILTKKGKVLIGRSREADICVPEFYKQVSRYHLSLQKSGNSIIATDLGSSNNTVVIPKNKIEAFNGGVENIKFAQSNIGDCYLLAAIYSLSQNTTGQNILKNMVKVDDDGNYVVQFYNHSPITVKLEELDGQKHLGSEKISVSGDLGIKAIERAYAKMIKNPLPYGHTLFLDIDEGGFMDKALKKMTGIKSSRYYTKNPADVNYILSQIAQDGMQNHIVTCATVNKGKYGKYADFQRRFITKHAYSVKYIDAFNQRIGIVNPHNTKNTYDISWNEFNDYFDMLCDAKVCS